MTLFRPPEPPRPAPAPLRPGERGTRGVPSGEEQPDGPPRRVQRGRERLERPNGWLELDGRLIGDGTNIQNSRWYYDADGNYVRVRGKKWLVERFGPRRALAQLTEPERAAVMNARRRAARRDKG